MKLISNSFKAGDAIPGEFAFAVIEPKTHITLSNNRNPHLAWDQVSLHAKSLAIICHDDDVPSRPDDVNKEGREIPADLPRIRFFHWSLFNLPPSLREIAAGSQSNAVTSRGKPAAVPGNLGSDVRHGLNDYTKWFTGDKDMAGDYFGYDGPCPPWNDTLMHRYVFTVYALDVARLNVPEKPSGADVMAAMQGHIIDQASITGLYTLNQRLAK